MTTEPKSGGPLETMTSEEAQMALALIRALEAQVRNLEKQIADISEKVGHHPRPEGRDHAEGSKPRQY